MAEWVARQGVAEEQMNLPMDQKSPWGGSRAGVPMEAKGGVERAVSVIRDSAAAPAPVSAGERIRREKRGPAIGFALSVCRHGAWRLCVRWWWWTGGRAEVSCGAATVQTPALVGMREGRMRQGAAQTLVH